MLTGQPPFNYNPFSGVMLATPARPKEWREDWPNAAWLYNPWSSTMRDAGDVFTDPLGRAIWDSAWGPLRAARKVGVHPSLSAGYGTPREADNVNQPAHYTQGGIECIDAIQAALTPEEYRGFLKGNVLKYTWRERHKGGEESLRKAEWYLKRLIALSLVLGSIAGCGSDYCSPFDKPDVTVLPVACAASTPCQE